MGADSKDQAVKVSGDASDTDRRVGLSRYPHPSNDPDDPLNWPTIHKLTTYLTICLFTFLANVSASNFTVAIVPLEKAFHVNSTHATFLIAFNVLMFGLGNILWVPLMRVVGKRPVYLLALALLVAANAWSAKASTWGSLLGGRMVAGFAAAAADATVPSAVADLFFVDERGHYMMFFSFALSAGVFLGQLINAYVVQLHSWRWSPGWIAVASGGVFVLAIFTLRETQYDRERHTDNQFSAPRTFVGWLSLTVGYNRGRPLERFFGTILDLLQMAIYPSILWSACLVGLVIGWTIVINITSAQIFLARPYRWKLGYVGLFSLAGFIGVMIAFYFGGALIDLIANRARRKDHTTKPKPEKRLVALVLPAIVAPTGLIVYGVCMAHKTSWVGPAFGFGMHSFGFTAISNIAVTYAVDSHQEFAGEGLVTLFIVRNVVAVVCSFYSNVWIARVGLEAVFATMAGIEWFFLGLGLIFYFLHGQILTSTARFGPQKRVSTFS